MADGEAKGKSPWWKKLWAKIVGGAAALLAIPGAVFQQDIRDWFKEEKVLASLWEGTLAFLTWGPPICLLVPSVGLGIFIAWKRGWRAYKNDASGPDYDQLYKGDIFDGTLWEWRYKPKEGEIAPLSTKDRITDLRAFCGKCWRELDIIYVPGECEEDQAMRPTCPPCRLRYPYLSVDYDETKEIQKQIEARTKTGQWHLYLKRISCHRSEVSRQPASW